MNRVSVTRGGRIESVHRVHIAVVDAAGRTLARGGDEDRPCFLRSAAKPIQALPLVEEGVVGRLGMTTEELAVCCASHSGQPRHVEVVRGLLARAEVPEDALRCGAHPPMHTPSADSLLRSGALPGRIHNNCSGKHAGMLALARDRGWPVDGYLEADHPVQRRMAREISRWTEVDEDLIPTAVDGCGVITFELPLRALAGALARFGASGDPGPRSVVRAMVSEPFLVAGEGRLCTDLMARAGDRLFAKTGAEGVYAAAAVDGSWGLALKVEDGARRASDLALVAVLAELGVLDASDLDALEAHARPPVLNTLGDRVGTIRADLDLGGVTLGAAGSRR